MRAHGTDLVVDVGANVGQYALSLRDSGYQGWIVSFEPLPDAFNQLERRTSQDRAWSAHQCALGSASGTATLHVSQDGVCSSLLQQTDYLVTSIATSVEIEAIQVPVKRLDEVALPGANSPMLKIDSQGYEESVLGGAVGFLEHVRLLEIEIAFAELYDGGSTIYGLLPKLQTLGFRVVSVSPGFVDLARLQTLDADFLLVRG